MDMIKFDIEAYWKSIIYSIIGILTIYCSFLFIRPWIMITVECWFCMTKSRIKYKYNNRWFCINCQQYNGFNSIDGSYNCPVFRMQQQKRQNNLKYCANSIQNHNAFRYEQYKLCDNCNKYETIKLHMKSEFQPINDEKFMQEYQKFQKNLELMYPICDECKQLVKKLIKDDNESLKHSKMLANSVPTVTKLSLNRKKFNAKQILSYSMINLVTISLLFIFLYWNQQKLSSNSDDSTNNYDNYYYYVIFLGFSLCFPLLNFESMYLQSKNNINHIIICLIQLCSWLLLLTNYQYDHYHLLSFNEIDDLIRLQFYIISILICIYLLKFVFFAHKLQNFNMNEHENANISTAKSTSNQPKSTDNYNEKHRYVQEHIKDLTISSTNPKANLMNTEFNIFAFTQLNLKNNSKINDQVNDFWKSGQTTMTKMINFQYFNEPNTHDEDNYNQNDHDSCRATKSNSLNMNNDYYNNNQPRILNYYIESIQSTDYNDNNSKNDGKNNINCECNCSTMNHQPKLCEKLTTTFLLIFTMMIVLLMIVILSLPAASIMSTTSLMNINYEFNDNYFGLKFYYPNFSSIATAKPFHTITPMT